MLDTKSPFINHGQTDGVGLTESRLRAAIIVGALAPGARLSEVELCQAYGRGRGIVRAALGKLAHGGFVVSHPRSGWKVSGISAAGLREIVMARSRLESLLAEAPLSAGDLASIQTICDMQAALRSSRSTASPEHDSLQRSYDRQIKELLVSKLKAPLVAGWLGNVWDRSERYLNYFERVGAEAAPWFDWAPFIEAKALARDDDAASILSDGCAAFARFAQFSLLASDLIAPEAAPRAPRAARINTTPPTEFPRRRDRPSKRTI